MLRKGNDAAQSCLDSGSNSLHRCSRAGWITVQSYCGVESGRLCHCLQAARSRVTTTNCVGRRSASTQREDGAVGRDTNGHKNHLCSDNHTVKRSRATDGFSNWFIIRGVWFIRPVIKLLSQVFFFSFCSTLATESKWQIVWASHICWSNLNYWWQDDPPPPKSKLICLNNWSCHPTLKAHFGSVQHADRCCCPASRMRTNVAVPPESEGGRCWAVQPKKKTQWRRNFGKMAELCGT